ncbi:MAG: NAD-binding protein [Thermoplasmata archaeon]
MPSRPAGTRRGLRASTMATLTAIGGTVLLFAGIGAAYFVPHPLYATALEGYDPPFDAVAGILLLALSVRIRERSRVAWLFSIIAPGLTIGIALASPNVFSLAAAILSAVLVATLYASRLRFFRPASSATEATQYAVLVSALLSVLYGMVGARYLGGQFDPPPGIRGWTQAFYFTITTISTNGSNWTPTTDSARWFVALLILVGVGTFLSAVLAFFLPFVEQRLDRVVRRLEVSQMEQLSEHVILCGAGPDVEPMAEILRIDQIPVIILTTDLDRVRQFEAAGIRSVAGESSSDETLRGVGIERARALIVAESSDAESVLTVLTARALVPKLRIVALTSSLRTVPKLERAGANEVINVVRVAARLVTDAALRPESPGKAPTA